MPTLSETSDATLRSSATWAVMFSTTSWMRGTLTFACGGAESGAKERRAEHSVKRRRGRDARGHHRPVGLRVHSLRKSVQRRSSDPEWNLGARSHCDHACCRSTRVYLFLSASRSPLLLTSSSRSGALKLFAAVGATVVVACAWAG
jgi:hypothetical protein